LLMNAEEILYLHIIAPPLVLVGREIIKIKMHSLTPWFIYCDIVRASSGISSWMSRIFCSFLSFLIAVMDVERLWVCHFQGNDWQMVSKE
jgi:hypothetical protein